MLFFVIFNLFGSSILIRTAVSLTQEQFFTSHPNNVVIINPHRHTPGASLEQLDLIRELSYVRSAGYGLHTAVQSRNFDFPSRFRDEVVNCHYFHGFCVFNIVGTNDSTLEIEEGQLQIINGRGFNSSEIEQGLPVLLVSQYFAELNNLFVGDVIEFELFVLGDGYLDDVNSINYEINSQFFIWHTHMIEVEIIGLFESTLDLSVDEIENLFVFGSNALYRQLYAPNLFVEEIILKQHVSHRLFYTEEQLLNANYTESAGMLPPLEIKVAEFTLYDFRDFEAFYQEASTILGSLYDDGYFGIGNIGNWGMNMMQSGMEDISAIIEGFLIFGSLAFILILVLILFHYLHVRRHEIGIYLSLGASKFSLVKQFMGEMYLISLPALMMSFISIHIISNNINAMDASTIYHL